MIKKIQGLMMVIGLWFVMYLLLQTPAIPNPFPTFIYAFQNVSVLLPHLAMSLMRIFVAVLFSATIGTGVGILMARNTRVDALLAPVVYILYPIPKIAFLPILMLLFGLGETPKIVLLISVIIFQFMMASKDAVKDINQEYFDSVKALNVTGINLYRHLIIPAILPSFFTALRASIGVSIAVLFFGENFSTKLGIGYFIMNSYAMVNYQAMYAGVIALSIMGLGLFLLIDKTEQRLCPWNQ